MAVSKRVLLIDDEQDDQEIFSEAIHTVDNSVVFSLANNGLEALAFLKDSPELDLIFLDLNMPMMNGYEFLAQLRKNSNYDHVPVIIYSTAKNFYDIDHCKKLGANLFFTKPVKFSALCDRLKEILVMEFEMSKIQ